ncbi:hypothetical protein C8R43DRAFT_619667 [Mycena crocata]|nr:hypothetical protein C8R43DRAFT_619667 [Mycena crocata]
MRHVLSTVFFAFSALAAASAAHINVRESCPSDSLTDCGPSPQSLQPLAVPSKRQEPECQQPGHRRCEIIGALGASECINVRTALTSCGGCVGPEGQTAQYPGVDCTMLPNVDGVYCKWGRCKITSCAKGYVLDERRTCVSSLVFQGL